MAMVILGTRLMAAVILNATVMAAVILNATVYIFLYWINMLNIN